MTGQKLKTISTNKATNDKEKNTSDSQNFLEFKSEQIKEKKLIGKENGMKQILLEIFCGEKLREVFQCYKKEILELKNPTNIIWEVHLKMISKLLNIIKYAITKRHLKTKKNH